MTISLYNLTCHCRWQSAACLPDYAGSTLRGAFGWALKRCACMLKSQDCPDCILNKSCAYAFLFASERYADGAGGPVNARPHPLVIQPGENCANDGHEGDSFYFSFLLIGRASEFLPHIVYSVKLMGEAGIGAGAKHGAGRFTLEQVVANEQTIFAAASGLLDNTAPPKAVNALTAWGREVSQLRVRFLTPLRLKKENNLADALPFQELIRATLRRISALESAYSNEGQGEPALDYRGLVERAAAVRLAQSSLRWRELRRFSNRQRQEVSLSGLIGEAVYEGNLAEFVPLLAYAGQVNVGKQTLFGLGRMEIELFENRD